MAAGDVKAVLTKVRAFSCNVFDGVDDYVEVPHHWKLLDTNFSQGLTISAWINQKGIGEGATVAWGRVVDKTAGTTAGDGFCVALSSTGTNFGLRIDGLIKSASAASIPIDGSWKHILTSISFLGVTNFYVNGVSSGVVDQAFGAGLDTHITTTNVLRIGNRSQVTDSSFDGLIKDVKIWNRVLTPAEARKDYEGFTPGNPINHFKLGGDYADYGSCGVAATNSGSVAFTVDDNVAVAVKAQRVAATDKWMIYRGLEGQVGVVNIE
jgi:hypothetical protein